MPFLNKMGNITYITCRALVPHADNVRPNSHIDSASKNPLDNQSAVGNPLNIRVIEREANK